MGDRITDPEALSVLISVEKGLMTRAGRKVGQGAVVQAVGAAATFLRLLAS
jgi:hypothetical protein